MNKFALPFILILSLLFFSPNIVLAQDAGVSSIGIDDLQLDDDYDEYEMKVVSDPYEKYNRWMFNVNDKVYRNIFTPLSKVYDFIIPKKAQGLLNNVFRFSSTPKRFFNNLFQKKYKSSWIEFERLLINASLGIGGLFDPAHKLFGLEQQTEDFGQTIGHYGYEAGSYIIWPVVGPSTKRDVIGFIGDVPFSPFFWFGIYDVQPEDAFTAFTTTKRVNNYPYNIRSNYERITESAVDPYIALQHAYIQHRENKINE